MHGSPGDASEAVLQGAPVLDAQRPGQWRACSERMLAVQPIVPMEACHIVHQRVLARRDGRERGDTVTARMPR
ncbi:hypothetical protein Xbuh_04355 [Xanthomonas axonopodis pv. bauhiniae]|uniref:Uncharacterized protein n=1 Tax=Xanthomonas cissicola TaxID=86186 RepID=A0ABX3M0Z1_9XANT|nr:hypothetical protein Xant_09415 [Xanthomonas cissicola]OOX22417.1 hypothetical protein Xbuh_04355 [Xanthomonas axonopodis pv. bauhiniae]